jgi:hypothetical protein
MSLEVFPVYFIRVISVRVPGAAGACHALGIGSDDDHLVFAPMISSAGLLLCPVSCTPVPVRSLPFASGRIRLLTINAAFHMLSTSALLSKSSRECSPPAE